MPKIFISYRRADSKTITGRIYDRLVLEFGKKNVFMDVDNIPAGADFRKVLVDAVESCDFLLVVMGDQWLDIEDEDGNRRLDDPADFVRIEVETGLHRESWSVIPLLVQGAKMPKSNELPESLQELPFRNAIPIRDDADFHRDVGRVVESIKQLSRNTSTGTILRPQRLDIPIIVGLILLLSIVVAVVLLSGVFSNGDDAEDNGISVTNEATDVTAPLTAARFPNGIGMNLDNPVTTNSQWEPYSETFEGIEMMLVPAGCFEMGSENGEDDEVPVHEQCFDEPFWIDRTEVTQADFERLGGEKTNTNGFDGDQRPVESITWFEARDFCELRGMRLPTEREWEYAARGPDNLVYPWGDEWNPDLANWSGTSPDETFDVGSFPEGASWVGALDMSGNVLEWNNSLYAAYPYEDNHESEENMNSTRILRGGSWGDNITGSLRSTYRLSDSPANGSNSLGSFRCAHDFNG